MMELLTIMQGDYKSISYPVYWGTLLVSELNATVLANPCLLHKENQYKTMKDKIVEITWNDAFHLTDSWLSLEEIANKYKESKFQVVNIGWLIFEDSKYVILAGKRNVDYGDYGFVMMIPKGMIIKRRFL